MCEPGNREREVPRDIKNAPRFVLTLRPVPAGKDRLGRDVVIRLRGALKVLLRRFGLRCMSCKPAWLHDQEEQADDGNKDDHSK